MRAGPDRLHRRRVGGGVRGIQGDALLAAAPRVAASTGSACHEGGTDPSPVLVAMGIPPPEALSAVRLSLGRRTTEAEIEEAATVLARAVGVCYGQLNTRRGSEA